MSASLNKLSVWIDDKCLERNAYKWAWEVFANYCGCDFYYSTSNDESTTFKVATTTGPLAYNATFWSNINAGNFEDTLILNENSHVCFEDGTPDYLMTAFYFINTVFERHSQVFRDELNRTDYSHSIWVRRNIAVDQPFVNSCFDLLANSLGLKVSKRTTQLWFSHDIDSVYGAFKQDGKWLLKQGRLWSFAKQTGLYLRGKIEWMNLTKIAGLEKGKGIRSSFFLLTEKGRVNQRAYNSDYLIKDKRLQSEISSLLNSGNEIGLHKSLSNLSYSQEIEKIGLPVWANRNHFLVMNWNNDLKEQIASGIKVDASLGYAEHYGFRNGFSLPFYPFDLETKTVLPILEIPLNLMDSNFSGYMKKSAEEAYDLVKYFIENNRENAVISILWHNSHFTDYKYKGFPKLYERLLDLTQNGSVNATDLTTLTQQYAFDVIHNNA